MSEDSARMHQRVHRSGIDYGEQQGGMIVFI